MNTKIAACLCMLGTFLTVAVITAPFWITLLIWHLPFLFLIYLVINYTSFGQKLYYQAYDWLAYRSEKPRNAMWQMFYSFLCWLYPNTFWQAMNYGYALLSSDGKMVDMSEDDEYERYPLQLYHFTSMKMGNLKDMRGKTLLEVGSGRGGGLSYLTRTGKPDRAVGVDFAQTQVDFCNQVHAEVDNLEFIQGDAQRLEQLAPTLNSEAFDYALNVESSHCYGDIGAFFRGVHWALKPDGRLFYTDFRTVEEVAPLEAAMEQAGFRVEKKENITANVLQALKLDGDRKRAVLDNHIHCLIRPLFRKFIGLEGSRIYQEFHDGQTQYLAYSLRKKD